MESAGCHSALEREERNLRRRISYDDMSRSQTDKADIDADAGGNCPLQIHRNRIEDRLADTRQ